MQNLSGIYYIFDKVGEVAYSTPRLCQNDLSAIYSFKMFLEQAEKSKDSLIRPGFFELRRICTVDSNLCVVDGLNIPICQGSEVNEVFERVLLEVDEKEKK